MTTAIAESASAYYIRLVKSKIASGMYHMESVACFCGATDSIPIIHRDRYGFDYEMVLCRECALMYANPRMTEETFKQFYKNEYRHIYDPDGMDKDKEFRDGDQSGLSLKSILENYSILPKTVFDIGCNSGAWLKAFKDAGATVYGVDYDEGAVFYGQEHDLPIFVGGISSLETLGIKADLIILNHTIEHFLDMEKELSRIRHLLNDQGIVYVGVPGLYATPKNILFQNAHTYQFIGDTLTYVMECSGFEEVYLNEQIQSIWRASPRIRSKSDKPVNNVEFIRNYMFDDVRKIPMIRTMTRFPVPVRKERLEKALALGIPDIGPLVGSMGGHTSIIIGGGPSIDGEIETLRALKEDGGIIVCIERMMGWCIDHDLMPDFVVVLDASEDVSESLKVIPTPPVYLVAAQAHIDALEALKWNNTYMFQTLQNGIDMATLWSDAGYDSTHVINAGGSVTLCAMALAMTMGMRDLHVFGFDCCFSDTKYAKGINGVSENRESIEIKVNDKDFVTRVDYLSYAQQFFVMKELSQKHNLLDSIWIHGRSLVSEMSIENIQWEGSIV